MKLLIGGGLWLVALAACSPSASGKSQLSFVVHSDGSTDGMFSSTIANDKISMHVGQQYGTKLIYRGEDLVGRAVGAYASYAGRYFDLNYTSAAVYKQTQDTLDVGYEAKEGTVHFVLTTGLDGFYSYFVNAALGVQGEFRTLYRLAPDLFPNGRTYLRDEPLPLFSDILNGTSVQDETWQRPDGTYITKYDWSLFVRESDFHGVYGDRFGAWVMNPGKDYYNGDQLKQELSVHRESQTNDAVLLNMLHGTHFQAAFSNTVPVGKVFGPWLVYLNNGSVEDAIERNKAEEAAWPYKWFENSSYQSRGSVSGRLVLDNGKPAAGAAIFLGGPGETISQGTTFQYTAYADSKGEFRIEGVRTESNWTLQAWSNGGTAIGGVTTVFSHGTFAVKKGKNLDLGKLTWKTQQGRTDIWQIGDFDRKSVGFAYGGAPYTHGLVDNCPANMTYTVGKNSAKDWCFGKSAKGTWSVLFDIAALPGGASSAVLSLSIAGFSGSGTVLGGPGSALEISLNGNALKNHATPIASDPSLYRSGTTAGEWYYYEFVIPQSWLVAGRNKLDLTTNKTATRWRGIMWDMVKMEWSRGI